MRFLVLTGLHVYRWFVSPLKFVFFGPAARCRFEPSCSEYAVVAVRRHGALPGSVLAAKRILRCHPWGGCGCDPVPAVAPRGARPSLESADLAKPCLRLGGDSPGSGRRRRLLALGSN